VEVFYAAFLPVRGGVGRPARIFLWNSTPHRAQFTPQIPQYVPYSLRFSPLVLNFLH
jgi:hypothetical protein